MNVLPRFSPMRPRCVKHVTSTSYGPHLKGARGLSFSSPTPHVVRPAPHEVLVLAREEAERRPNVHIVAQPGEDAAAVAEERWRVHERNDPYATLCLSR